jgi:hypothetical protein
MSWYPQACPVCNGDLYEDALDRGDVTCMMCARSFAAKDLITVQRIRHAQMSAASPIRRAEAA